MNARSFKAAVTPLRVILGVVLIATPILFLAWLKDFANSDPEHTTVFVIAYALMVILVFAAIALLPDEPEEPEWPDSSAAPPREPTPAGIPIPPRHPQPLAAHAIPPRDSE